MKGNPTESNAIKGGRAVAMEIEQQQADGRQAGSADERTRMVIILRS